MTDWSTLKVKELKDELEKRGLDSSGKKAELVERLEAHEGGDKGEEAPTKDGHVAADATTADDAPAEDAKDAPGKDEMDEDPQDHASPRELPDEDNEDAGDANGESNKRQRTTEDGQAKKVRKLCRTLFVTGFKEPPNEADVRTLMETHGKVDTLWVSREKNEAMVFFQEADAATAARKVIDGFEWPEGSGASLKSVYRNIHIAIKYVRRSGDADFNVELTEEDPTDEKKSDKDDRAPNPFRKTTTEPVLYWKTARVYP